ncbi:MAG TPA: metallophosphoesterase family protein, partial [Bryobacteraceae bacterium]|nr:metallophosphoesterase family protein [Bryobacteraceae bacterium]
DIHGNVTAFEAVLADLFRQSPDLVFHGGDMGFGGSDSAAIIDRIRDLGWAGVVGNTDEVMYRPESLTEYSASVPPNYRPIFDAIGEIADFERAALSERHLEWLRALPMTQLTDEFSLVHATPAHCWKSPYPEASDEDIDKAYRGLDRRLVIYGHVHRSFTRELPGLTVVNTGSVGQSHDGDTRASYLLLDDGVPAIRRVEYDVEREIKAIEARGMPHLEWVTRMLRIARPQAY